MLLCQIASACFSNTVIAIAKSKNISQIELVRLSQLSPATISRIFRNSNDKGSSYEPSLQVVLAICVALGLSSKEAAEVQNAAFPEMAVCRELFGKGLNIFDVNEILDDLGLKILGTSSET